jgi:hypothetical protein
MMNRFPAFWLPPSSLSFSSPLLLAASLRMAAIAPARVSHPRRRRCAKFPQPAPPVSAPEPAPIKARSGPRRRSFCRPILAQAASASTSMAARAAVAVSS